MTYVLLSLLVMFGTSLFRHSEMQLRYSIPFKGLHAAMRCIQTTVVNNPNIYGELLIEKATSWKTNRLNWIVAHMNIII